MAGGEAFGAPGVPGRWTSGQKCGVGTALGPSPVWFTLSHGIVNEVYWPRMDQAMIRDLGLIITGPEGLFCEEKRHCDHKVELVAPGVPAYRLTSTEQGGRLRIVKEVVTDPDRPVVLQRVRLRALKGHLRDYRLFALLAAHLDNRGEGNTAFVGEYKGVPGLFAVRSPYALCLMASEGLGARSAGYVGSSDGWQDLTRHGQLTWRFDQAGPGNVALTGELSLAGGETVIALGFGRSPEEAAHQARGSLLDGFQERRDAYVAPWRAWQESLVKAPGRRLFAVSAMVARVHTSKHLPGAILASLAVPWGFAQGDGDLGGYHLVWPRDMVEAAGGFLAAGEHAQVREALVYLETTQEADGHWLQNMWLEGAPYWGGVQMDETALPILLVDLARREGALETGDRTRLWPMVRRAASFIARTGPVTQQDRWEEDGGYTPFTLAAEIAALLAAADLAEEQHEGALAAYLRETADTWNDAIERWLYVEGTDTAREAGVDGYYVRITPPDIEEGDTFVPIKNRPAEATMRPAAAIVSTDALALVRFGLRAADDPRIVSTVRVLDTLLRTETPVGPCWRRYNEDGYGEHDDGSPFDGTGRGRLWPLLTGERGHYALAAGDRAEARRLLATMEGLAGEGDLLPEQTWDGPAMPERELWFGRPAGSAMPLVWAHAEYLKLARSLTEERVFDMPPQTVERYLRERRTSPYVSWRFNHKIRAFAAGRILRVECLAPATVHWSTSAWADVVDTPTRPSGTGVHYADLDTHALAPGGEVVFTFYWPEENRWEGTDFTVRVDGAA